ncbi:MAG: IS1595 family transposase [Betaproteobacteria bacterium]|jgi:transposase-like protein|nr:IS1595 family transposase [Betaproteobacteria bacterium]
MKTTEFKGLIEQLGELTEVQRTALMAALNSKGSANEAIALIETRFAAAPACGHCKSERFGTWGWASGLRRYKCKECKRTFNALTGTPLAQLHRRDAWLEYARAIVDRVSLRKAAERADVCLETSFRWRHRFLAAARDKRPSVVTGIVEADETFILKSAKGSRKIVGRAPRKRGGKASRPGLSTDEHDAILIVRDRHAATTDHILPDLEGRTFKAYLAPIVAKDAVLVTDGRAAYSQFADEVGIDHITLITSAGEHALGSYHLQNNNGYQSRFKLWMAPFKGVSSKYLPTYLGWRRMIERDGERLTPRHAIAEALDA